MDAGFVCKLGWRWRFGGDYGLFWGDTNRGGANVLLLPVIFGAGAGDVGRSRWVVVFFLIGDVDIDFFFLKWDEIEGELCLPRAGRALMVLCFP
jgi:hypothetical protein